MSLDTLPEVLTVPQLAQLLECEPETVEVKTRLRELPGLKFGRSWIYPRAAVLEVLTRQALAYVVATPPAPAPAPAARAAAACAAKPGPTMRVVPMTTSQPGGTKRRRVPPVIGDPPSPPAAT